MKVLLIEDDEALQQVRKQSLSRERRDWRPAVELLGEGIFVTLREDAVGIDVEERHGPPRRRRRACAPGWHRR